MKLGLFYLDSSIRSVRIGIAWSDMLILKFNKEVLGV